MGRGLHRELHVNLEAQIQSATISCSCRTHTGTHAIFSASHKCMDSRPCRASSDTLSRSMVDVQHSCAMALTSLMSRSIILARHFSGFDFLKSYGFGLWRSTYSRVIRSLAVSGAASTITAGDTPLSFNFEVIVDSVGNFNQLPPV